MFVMCNDNKGNTLLDEISTTCRRENSLDSELIKVIRNNRKHAHIGSVTGKYFFFIQVPSVSASYVLDMAKYTLQVLTSCLCLPRTSATTLTRQHFSQVFYLTKAASFLRLPHWTQEHSLRV